MSPARLNSGLDKLNTRIIELLRVDGRRSNRELARVIGVSESTIRKRLRKLRESGVLRITALTEPRALGYTSEAIVSIHAEIAKLDAISERIAKIPEVRYVGITTGRSDITCVVLLRSVDDIYETVTKKIASIPGVRQTETSITVKVIKRTYDWFEVGGRKAASAK
ncbi:MAG: Lrp/AsnC family transcriptional regulator [Chloroflexi bacterium]|nr:Lrp/AsnC family transcriptional regulator [Chloroflexota bacterium]